MTEREKDEALASLLDAYVLGLEDDDARRKVEAHLADRGADGVRARALLAESKAAAAALAVNVEPLAVPSALRDRLLSSVAATNRFEDFVDRVSSLLDVTVERAGQLLEAIDGISGWVRGPSSTSSIQHLVPGPSVQLANVGFVRVEAGAQFPRHTHIGEERVLILQGALQYEDGGVRKRGDLLTADDGTTHSFVALPGPDLIYLVMLERGVIFDVPFEL